MKEENSVRIQLVEDDKQVAVGCKLEVVQEDSMFAMVVQPIIHKLEIEQEDNHEVGAVERKVGTNQGCSKAFESFTSF